MKTKISAGLFCCIYLLSAVFFLTSCAGKNYSSQNLKISRSSPIPPQFVVVESYDSKSITISINVKFTQAHLYHILSDEQDTFIAEGWFPTSKDSSGRYSVTMEAKEGFSFTKGQRILLCIGQKHPDEYIYGSTAYQCMANIWLTLE